MGQFIRKVGLVLGAAGTLAISAGAAASEAAVPAEASPTEEAEALVSSLGEGYLDIVRRHGEINARCGEVRSLLDGSVDLGGITARVAPDLWAELDEAGRQRLGAAYTAYILADVSSMVDYYQSQTFEMAGSRQAGSGVEVESSFRAGGFFNASLDLTWIVEPNETGAWRIVDVKASDDGFIADQRRFFEEMMSITDGNAALIVSVIEEAAGVFPDCIGARTEATDEASAE